jgi:ataxia telangiectasia mutated family protein
MTILDVLIHDPLYKWMLSPRDARHRQRAADDDSDGGAPAARDAGGLEDRACAPPADNQAAERALLRVRQKLQGYGDDDSDVLGVHGQVRLSFSVHRGLGGPDDVDR